MEKNLFTHYALNNVYVYIYIYIWVNAKLGARHVADSIKKWTDLAVTAKMEVLNAADSR
jgi:hypothetical protein